MDVDFLCVFLAYLLIWVPLGHVAGATITGDDERARRAAAARTNTFEAFAPFAAAVIIARLRYTDPVWTHALCVAFVAARAAYPFLYASDRPTLRSAAWGIGTLATGGLYALALLP